MEHLTHYQVAEGSNPGNTKNNVDWSFYNCTLLQIWIWSVNHIIKSQYWNCLDLDPRAQCHLWSNPRVKWFQNSNPNFANPSNFCSPTDTVSLNFFQQMGPWLLPPSEWLGLALNASLNFPTFGDLAISEKDLAAWVSVYSHMGSFESFKYLKFLDLINYDFITCSKNPKCPTLAPSSEHVNSPIGYRPLVSHEKQLDSGAKKNCVFFLFLYISLTLGRGRVLS